MKLTTLIGGIIAFLFMCVILSTCTLVHPTEAGFKISKAGSYRGVENLPLVTGYNFYLPWATEIKTIPTTMQHVVWADGKEEGDKTDQAVSISCMGGAGFRVDVGLNYHVNASMAPRIYLKWKETDLEDITSKYIRNVTRGAMQDISGTITVDSVLNNLPGFEHAVRIALSDTLAAQGFIVDNFSILKQPEPTDDGLKKSIAAKITARQNAERVRMELQSSEAEANKKIATARGDSASYVIEQAGKAEGIRVMQAQLTPTYVEYVKWSNAGDNVPRVPQYVGAGGFGFPLK